MSNSKKNKPKSSKNKAGDIETNLMPTPPQRGNGVNYGDSIRFLTTVAKSAPMPFDTHLQAMKHLGDLSEAIVELEMLKKRLKEK